jgi:hypothetical protein
MEVTEVTMSETVTEQTTAAAAQRPFWRLEEGLLQPTKSAENRFSREIEEFTAHWNRHYGRHT